MLGVFIGEKTIRHFIVTFFFPDLEISRRNISDTTPEIRHKEMFLITLVETLNNAFARNI